MFKGYGSRMKNEKSNKLWWVVSPTYKYAEGKKHLLLERGSEASELSSALKGYNKSYLLFSIIICLAVQILDWLGKFLFPETGFQYHHIVSWIYWPAMLLVIWGFLSSRAIEICKAFLDDAIEKLNGEKPISDLKFGDRLRLALKSYVELIINFGTLYFVAPSCFYKDDYEFNSILEAIYFSGVTITTLGYGDISPTNWALQLATVAQVITGFSLIVVAFAIYSSLALSNIKPETKCNFK